MIRDQVANRETSVAVMAMGAEDPIGWYISVLSDVVMLVVTTLVVVGGTIPYYFQYREIVRTENGKGFSLYVCMTLLMANILRILFW